MSSHEINIFTDPSIRRTVTAPNLLPDLGEITSDDQVVRLDLERQSSGLEVFTLVVEFDVSAVGHDALYVTGNATLDRDARNFTSPFGLTIENRLRVHTTGRVVTIARPTLTLTYGNGGVSKVAPKSVVVNVGFSKTRIVTIRTK